MLRPTKVNQDPALANKAVLYLRYSSESQTENSIEGQRRECMAFAKSHNIVVLGEYVDRAMTGTNDARPDFQRMIRDSANHVFGNVIVWKSDRFSRDMVDNISYKRQLEDNGVRLLSATEANLEGPMGTFLDSINGGLNQMYSEDLSIKVKRGNRENVLQGKHLGGCLQFGYRKTEDGRLEIDPNEGPIAQEIFRLYGKSDMSALAIAKKLKAEGKRRNDGREISHSTIEKMLKSEKYIGVLKCEGARNENAVPPLVSKELFDLCQKKRSKRKHKNFAYRGKEDYYLSGKIVCEKCGAMFLGESGTSHTGEVHSYYKCNGAKHHKCDAKPIRKEELEELTCCLILSLMADDEVSEKLADYIFSQQKNEAPEILSMRKRKEVVERKIANLVDAISEGIRTPSTKSALLALEAERDKLDTELGEKTISSKKFSKEEILFAIRELAKTGVDTPEQRQALLNNFVKRILVKEDGSMVFEFDLFGYEPTVSMGSEDFKKVRINPSLLRQLKCIRTLYVHHYGFGVTIRLDKGNRIPKELLEIRFKQRKSP